VKGQEKRLTSSIRSKPEICLCAFERIYAAYGPQHWWPAETDEEVIIGAVLTQNTSWKNVEKALGKLRAAGTLTLTGIATMETVALSELIRSAGYYNLKARRLQALARYFVDRCDGQLERLSSIETSTLREDLIQIYGIGPETADSVLLYALRRPIFVVDAYTLRIGARHGWFPQGTKYEDARSFFERSVPPDVEVYNEFHALLVKIGGIHCKPRPICQGCPLNNKGCGRIRLAQQPVAPRRNKSK
jgi:endonuclease III related protein